MARTIIIGTDQGVYTPNNGLYTITLSEINFIPKIEDLAYVINYTQNKTYYAAAENLMYASISGNVITIRDSFDALGGDDKIHIQFWFPVNENNPSPSTDIDPSGRNSLNTVFGEKLHAIRKANIAAQFQYGFPSSSANAEILNGGTIAIIESMLTLNTGTNVAGLAAISNKKALRYIPGHEAFLYFTAVFTQGVADSHQRSGLFDVDNGFFVGYEGINFCVTRRRDGVDTSHNIDITTIYLDGAFDPTKGNVYRISFGYLGFATIHFEVMLPGGGWTRLHEIEYPNSATVTHILNTNLQPRVEVANSGNNTDVQFQTGSFEAGVANGGGEDPAARRFTFTQTSVSISPTVQDVITFRVRATFNSLTNYIQSILTLLSVATDLSKVSTWEFRKDMTITNSPTWTDINTLDSTVEYSTDAIITAGTGISQYAFSMARVTDRILEDIESQEIELFPEETMTIVVSTAVGTTGTFDLSLRWKELF